MNKGFMKKAAAATLSAVMAVSMTAAGNLTVVSAEAPYVKLNTTFKTLESGGGIN